LTEAPIARCRWPQHRHPWHLPLPGRIVVPRPLWAMGWLLTAVMAAAVIAMFATW